MVSFELMSPEMADDLAESVLSQREQFIPRGPGFATLGRAIYLDVANKSAVQQAQYFKCLEANNQLLEKLFGWVQAALIEKFERNFGGPVRAAEGLAVPGFHIFEKDGISTGLGDMPHFDQQWRHVEWPAPLDVDKLVSLTLAARLPHEGGGLERWPITEQDVLRDGVTDRFKDMKWLRSQPSQIQPYEPGFVYVQLNPRLHRIAPVAHIHPGDQRISMQAHAVFSQNEWLLYW